MQPFRQLLHRLPPFSQLVKRREFHAANDKLMGAADVKVDGRNSFRDAARLRTHIQAPISELPWTLSGGARHLSIAPGWLMIPGHPEAYFPRVNGRSLKEGPQAIAGEGIVCIKIQMIQRSRLMTKTSWSFPDPDPAQAELVADCTVLLRSYEPVEVISEPMIVIVSGPSHRSAELNLDAYTGTAGDYLIPIGCVYGDVITQFITRPMQVGLRGAFLQIRALGE